MGGRGIEHVFPASTGQERLWFLDRLAPGVYAHVEAFRIRGPLDLVRIEKALAVLADRHASLRTTFRADGARVSQVVAERAVPHFHVREIADVAAFIAAETHKPWDLSTGPLWEVACGRLKENDHVLVLRMHHIISDGWSVGILLEELGRLYSDPATPLAPVDTHFSDWTRRQEGVGLDEGVLDWWAAALAGAPPLVDLPLDRPRPPVQTFPARSARLEIGAAAARDLADWARARGSTLFAALATASSAVLARWSGQDELVIGVPTAARDDADIEGTVGFFVRTVLLRADLSGEPTWDTLLERIRASFLAALAHSDVPFETLVDRLTPARDPALTPLFNVALALQDAGRGGLALEQLDVEPLEHVEPTVPFDLMIQFQPVEGGALGLRVDANADLFDKTTVDRLARHLARAIEAAPRSATAPVSRLELFDPGELDRIVALSSTAPPPLPDSIWTDLFAEAVGTHSSEIALQEGPAGISYAELDRRSDEAAQALHAKGIGRGDLVAILQPRSADLVIALIAVLKAGAAFLPLSPSDPEPRVGRIIGDALPDLVLDGPLAASSTAPPSRPASEPDDLAYVIYTSGSTGEPKGVQTLQRGLANLAAAQRRLLDVGPGDRVLSWFAPTFDAFLFELNLALLGGATLVLAPAEDLRPGPPLTAVLDRERVSVLCATPSVLAVTEPPATPQLRLVAACAEACPASVVERWSAPGREIVNCYGPTETSCCTNIGRCVPDGRRPNVGPPLAGVREYVMDAGGGFCPIGLPGELYIGGAAVGPGYRGLGALTAERFVADPLLPGGTAYRTGDRARLLTDGAIEILGRLDDQVKIRGHRVEPAETAAALRHHAAVRDVAVVPRSVSPNGPVELVAYVVAGDSGDLDPASLRGWARDRLPEYLVPAHVLLVDRLPLLPSGKLDRHSLPDPVVAPPLDGWSPATATERDVAAVWSSVLGHAAAGPRGFFDAGGNSLLVVALADQLERRLGVTFELAELFRWTTVAQQAEVVEQRRGDPTPDRVAVYEL